MLSFNLNNQSNNGISKSPKTVDYIVYFPVVYKTGAKNSNWNFHAYFMRSNDWHMSVTENCVSFRQCSNYYVFCIWEKFIEKYPISILFVTLGKVCWYDDDSIFRIYRHMCLTFACTSSLHYDVLNYNPHIYIFAYILCVRY